MYNNNNNLALSQGGVNHMDQSMPLSSTSIKN